MLFVDEAYSLVKDSKDSFGKEALVGVVGRAHICTI
jgi:hypothetical protein